MDEVRRFARIAAAGSLVAFLLDALMLSAGHLDLFPDPGVLGGFYDGQGRAMLDGRLAVDPAAAGFEGFVVDGNTYIYFGPVLSLLRMPVLAVTHGLDGRLTLISMVVGFAALLAAGAWLHWQLRAFLRPGAPIDRFEGAAVFLLQVALGAGAIPLFLASRAVVYHETELWGAALAVGSLAALVMVLRRPSARRIALAGLLVALAINTRVPAGLGGVLALWGLATMAATGLGLRTERRARTAVALAAAGLVALGSSAVVNVAKFDQPFGIPLDKQVFSGLDQNRKAALAANGGSLFGAKYVPTTLLQAVRPDAVGTTRSLPYVGLPHDRPALVGDVRFDTLERSLSAPTSMPLLVLLALAGLVVAVVRRPLRPLLVLAGAAAAGAGLSLTIAYVTTRYLADFLPFLLLAALIGVQALLPAPAAGGRTARRLVLAAAAVLVVAGIVVNGSVGLVTQRLLSAETAEADRAAFVRTQDRADDLLGRRPAGVGTGAALPALGVPGDLFVLGDCDGLYAAGQFEWVPVERTPRSGVHRLRARLGEGGRPRVLATVGTGAGRVRVVAGPGRRVAVRTARGVAGTGARQALPPGHVAEIGLSFDRLSASTYYLTVSV
ncbi:MAG TPA: hypothetical protein VFY44_01545, partial [Thermoleophilaceae bacterium]|nr:hypothetical protein [Thermoleophilaceae bacterium]